MTTTTTLDEEQLRFLRDFVLNAALYVNELETALGEERAEFWEDRERAYQITSGALIDLYQDQFEEADSTIIQD